MSVMIATPVGCDHVKEGEHQGEDHVVREGHPQVEEQAARDHQGKTRRCSFLYSPGATKAQRWYRAIGIEMNTATTSASLKGVRKGDATWVAIMLVPSGRWASNGVAREVVEIVREGEEHEQEHQDGEDHPQQAVAKLDEVLDEGHLRHVTLVVFPVLVAHSSLGRIVVRTGRVSPSPGPRRHSSLHRRPTAKALHALSRDRRRTFRGVDGLLHRTRLASFATLRFRARVGAGIRGIRGGFRRRGRRAARFRRGAAGGKRRGRAGGRGRGIPLPGGARGVRGGVRRPGFGAQVLLELLLLLLDGLLGILYRLLELLAGLFTRLADLVRPDLPARCRRGPGPRSGAGAPPRDRSHARLGAGAPAR